jgi:hypothetical protein
MIPLMLLKPHDLTFGLVACNNYQFMFFVFKPCVVAFFMFLFYPL